MTVRTRFAPSPTGSLHIGGARTALYNYLLAKKLGGTFVLRIEDTDKARNSEQSLRQLLNELIWLDLHWDEGIATDTLKPHGPHGQYQQSLRQPIYNKYINQLLESGQAYYCFADEDSIEQHRQQHADAPHMHFQSSDKHLSLDTAKKRLAAGEPAVVRYLNTHADETFVVNDLVRGEITFPGNMIGDFILQRADGSPVYNFCCAVDDCTMEITHVLRGEEHLPNTLRQMMIIDALGFKRPQYGHLSLILGEGNKKLSKRDGAASVSEFQKSGYTHEGLINYLALLGWSDPDHREILSLENLTSAFSTERLNSAPPHFDAQKLRWVNHQQIQRYNSGQLYSACIPFLQAANLNPSQDPAWIESTLPLFQADLHTLDDCCAIFAKLCDHSALLTPSALDVLQWSHIDALLTQWLQALFDTISDVNISITDLKPLETYLQTYTDTQATYSGIIKHLSHQIASDPHADKLLPQTLYQLIDKITAAGSNDLRTALSQCLDPDSYTTIAKSIGKTLDVKGKQLFMPLRVAILGNNEGMDLKLACRLIPIGSLIKRGLYAQITLKMKK